MAYASWANPSKTSGNGNDTVSWSASAHTGREARQTTATFAASGVESKTLTIIQSGKTEFVSFDSATAAVDKAGGHSYNHGDIQLLEADIRPHGYERHRLGASFILHGELREYEQRNGYHGRPRRITAVCVQHHIQQYWREHYGFVQDIAVDGNAE